MDINFKTEKCVMCGYCCTKGPCSYGLWDKKKSQCTYLDEPNEFGERKCLQYDLIQKDIMFNAGCSSRMFNTVRAEVLMKTAKR